MTAIVDALTHHPELAVLLAIVLRAGLAWQRGLSWYEYRTIHGLKRTVFPLLDRVEPFGYGVWVTTKGDRSDPEWYATLHTSVRDVVRELTSGESGGSLHLINAVKRRPPGRGDPLSRAHVVWTHSDGTQVECYLFSNSDGSTDLYVHTETSVTDPSGHLTDEQVDGDPKGVVGEALGSRE